MEAEIKIAAVGGTQDIADELCQAVKGILQKDIAIVPLTQSEVLPCRKFFVQEAIAASMTACKGEFTQVVEASAKERAALGEVFSALDNIGAISEDLLTAVENLG